MNKIEIVRGVLNLAVFFVALYLVAIYMIISIDEAAAGGSMEAVGLGVLCFVLLAIFRKRMM